MPPKRRQPRRAASPPVSTRKPTKRVQEVDAAPPKDLPATAGRSKGRVRGAGRASVPRSRGGRSVIASSRARQRNPPAREPTPDGRPANSSDLGDDPASFKIRLESLQEAMEKNNSELYKYVLVDIAQAQASLQPLVESDQGQDGKAGVGRDGDDDDEESPVRSGRRRSNAKSYTIAQKNDKTDEDESPKPAIKKTSRAASKEITTKKATSKAASSKKTKTASTSTVDAGIEPKAGKRPLQSTAPRSGTGKTAASKKRKYSSSSESDVPLAKRKQPRRTKT